MIALILHLRAQTLVSGNIEGTWSPEGNPYIAADDCTVREGKTLTLQPGVVFLIGSNLTITVKGVLHASGTPDKRIVFDSPVSTRYWNAISIANASGTCQFKHCTFNNAQTAISMRVYAGNRTMTVEVMNCSFSNCAVQAVYGEAEGYGGTWGGENATLKPVIKNCVFADINHGCVLKLHGSKSQFGWTGYGCAQPTLIANVFRDLLGTALWMSAGNFAGNSRLLLLNNTVVRCQTAIVTADPWDAVILNNVFVEAAETVKATGALSRTVGYNCFFGNGKDFTGYPSGYGDPIWTNRNGTTCDIFYNMFENPSFFNTSEFQLAPDSPCIDAGSPDWAFADMCFPPSQGTGYPDLGAYGGPDACNWLDTVPKQPVELFMTRTNRAVWANWGALPRSEYQLQYTTGLSAAGTTLWQNFPGGRVIAADKLVALQVATNGVQAQMFFRVQSLGRRAGN